MATTKKTNKTSLSHLSRIISALVVLEALTVPLETNLWGQGDSSSMSIFKTIGEKTYWTIKYNGEFTVMGANKTELYVHLLTNEADKINNYNPFPLSI